MNNNNRLVDIVLIIILYVGISTLPINLMTSDMFIHYVIEIILMVIVLLFIFMFTRRNPYIKPPLDKPNKKYSLLLLPTIVVAFSNVIYALILKEKAISTFSTIDIPRGIFIVILVVVEEVIFRWYLMGYLSDKKPLIRILISSGVFALCHLTHFFSSFNPIDLIIVVYTFGLGIVLGFIFEYGKNIYLCIVVHAAFNLINDLIFTNLFSVSSTLWYYLINIFVALFVALYIVIIYFVFIKEKPVKTDLN